MFRSPAIDVAHEEGKQNDIRAILGNDIAIKALREGKLPFPDGAIIARLLPGKHRMLYSLKSSTCHTTEIIRQPVSGLAIASAHADTASEAASGARRTMPIMESLVTNAASPLFRELLSALRALRQH
jgi:hypothetical protein